MPQFIRLAFSIICLIHWAPILKTDDAGKVIVPFYNADTKGKMQVIVEAIDENGAIGYGQLSFDVEE